MFQGMKTYLQDQIQQIKQDGLYKAERVITGPQRNRITVKSGESVLNFCANNYLGLSNHPEVIQAARDSYDKWGFGLSSVRFICGTQQIHKELEQKVAEFLGTEDTILYGSCFDANGGLFETLVVEQIDATEPDFRDNDSLWMMPDFSNMTASEVFHGMHYVNAPGMVLDHILVK